MAELDGKVVLVTGAGHGIGKAAAQLLHSNGAWVILTDIDTEAAAQQARDLGVRSQCERLDVADEHAWARVVDDAVDRYGQLDGLVNSAGVMKPAKLGTVDAATWESTLRVNQTGVLWGMQTAAKPMVAAGAGSIVNISSYAGVQGAGSSIAYTATKWAVRGMTRFAARELAPQGVRVNCVVPGVVDTPMLRQTDPRFIERAKAATPLGRIAGAREVAELIVWLLDDRSSFVTGADYHVDGALSS